MMPTACTKCKRYDCALPHAASYHRPYHADHEQLTRLLQRLADSGGLTLSSVHNDAAWQKKRDFELLIRGRQCGPWADKTTTIDSVTVRADGHILFCSADFPEHEREVYHRCLFSTQTKKLRHARQVINCILDTWIWESRSTLQTICEVAAAMIHQFGEQKFYHREHGVSSPYRKQSGRLSNIEAFDRDEHYKYLMDILQPSGPQISTSTNSE